MDTQSTNKQLEVNSYVAAMSIIDMLEEYGFTTDIPIDPVELKKEISDTIQYFMKEIVPAEPENPPKKTWPTGNDLDDEFEKFFAKD